MRESEAQIARGDLRNQRGALLGAGGAPEEAAGENDGGEIRLQRQRAAERLHDQHRLDGAAAKTAVLFGEGHAEQAELRVPTPELLAETQRRRPIGLAALEAVSILHQPRDIVGDEALFLVEIEVHISKAPGSLWR